MIRNMLRNKTGRDSQNFVYTFSKRLGWVRKNREFQSILKKADWGMVHLNLSIFCAMYCLAFSFQDILLFIIKFSKHNIYDGFSFLPLNRILSGLNMCNLCHTALLPCSCHLLPLLIVVAWRSGVREYHLLMKT